MDDLERTLKEFRHLIKERNDLSRRIKKAERSLESMADPTRTIKVSRGKHNGSALGTETVEGWTVDAARLQRSIRRYKALLARTHADITDMILEAERCVEAIDSSEVRTILRLRYIDGLSWVQVAYQIGGANSADGCRMIARRWFDTH